MAHGRTGPDLVMATRYVSSSAIRALSEHELNRTPDGTSAIDTERTHLNQILVGPACQQLAVDQLFASGVRKPATQAENPFVQIVLSASPSFFRRDDQGPGEWDQEVLDSWLETSLDWLKKNFGSDLIHVSLHLDEDTPHLHVLIAPTYQKKQRTPGRQKRDETEEEFEERKRVAKDQDGVRTVSRSSNAYWKRNFVRRLARQSYHEAVEPLGLGYGKDFVGEGLPSPQRKETGVWVRERAAELKEERSKLQQIDDELFLRLQKVLRSEAVDKERHREAEAVLEAIHADISEQTSALEALKAAQAALTEALDEREALLDGREFALYEREEVELPHLELQIEELKGKLTEEQIRAKEVADELTQNEAAAAAAEERRQTAEADLAGLEVLRPAVEAAQAIAALTKMDPTTRDMLFDSMSPPQHLRENRDEQEQWAAAIRMCDPNWSPGVALRVPRTCIPDDNFYTLGDHTLTSDEDFDALVSEVRKEAGAREAVAALQRNEIVVSDLDEPTTPATSWAKRALDGVKRGFGFAKIAVSETAQALAGVFHSLPEPTQAALSRLFSSRNADASAPTGRPDEPSGTSVFHQPRGM